MEKKLKVSDYILIASMLFGLFFGAGNLIFPLHMGQEAGASIFQANLGFLTTGIGLPFLGIIAVGLSQTSGVFEMASRINRKYAYIFTVLLYLVIGPLFALPRLATTSFEIGFAEVLPSSALKPALAIFSILFFFSAWWFARKPSKILDYIGKFLNPIFLILLGFLLIIAFIRPMGASSDAVVGQAFQTSPYFVGFTQGYNTLDALAALAFGIIIVTTIRQRGVTNPKIIAIDTIKSGVISVLLMGIIYTCLSYLGAMSVAKFKMSANGGIALSQIAHYYLGTFGMVILALIIVVACLKTAVGLITAFSETFVGLFPSRSYLFFATTVSILPCLFANIGLTKLITLSIPVLMFIYPLAITLILLSLVSPLFKHDKVVYQVTTIFTLIAAIFDGLNAILFSGNAPQFITVLINFAKTYIPFFTIGMGWVVPALIGFVIGFICSIIRKQLVNHRG
ncbi:MAG: branched-chain amino acid transport system II carrier protein [Lactococcus plantarum]|nr:branched-chain amino acid transport system II carrier protein [Lactococcus plantarum]MDN6085296.1 branched-chain amino acid transport system II carrier protein [Lactococcus plantarum]